MRTRTTTKRQREQDEQILAAIVSLPMVQHNRFLQPHMTILQDRYTPAVVVGSGCGYGAKTAGPCCAVGAGVLYAGLQVDYNARDAFEDAYDVSGNYSLGVSDGFEDTERTTYADVLGIDYQRGCAVGRAVRTYFYGETVSLQELKESNK